ncbi:MAG: NAD(P) transhydrogenase subunit alpha [Candidatus Omnitrophica bacterium]|nr:NAD(P) transhydrogenase subunit alpha [Candidatus Omnitrophota bacterium]
MPFIYLLYVLVLSVFLGFALINRVPPLLHTPLMSEANAICGIIIVGALVAAGSLDAHSPFTIFLGVSAVALATFNLVGGYLVTERMLKMFKSKSSSQGAKGEKK